MAPSSFSAPRRALGRGPGGGTGSVRVIAGLWRGRRLRVERGDAVRPTADRVKEALFSILAPRLEGARVVDCFAGTGALGIEALSRGAAAVAFIEEAEGSLRLLRENLKGLGDGGGTPRVVRADGLRPVTWPAEVLPADLILADPPYRRGIAGRLLAALAEEDALLPQGLLVVEHERAGEPGHPAWTRVDCRCYGDTALSFFAPAGSPA